MKNTQNVELTSKQLASIAKARAKISKLTPWLSPDQRYALVKQAAIVMKAEKPEMKLSVSLGDIVEADLPYARKTIERYTTPTLRKHGVFTDKKRKALLESVGVIVTMADHL